MIRRAAISHIEGPDENRVDAKGNPDPSEMYTAFIDVAQHGEAIQVIGKDLDECCIRAVIVRNAFNDVTPKV